MTAIGPVGYVALVHRELDALNLPDGPRRRTGVRDLDRVLKVTRNDVQWIEDSIAASRRTPSAGAFSVCGRVREVTSMLYAAGAAHEIWRHWAALAAFGLLLEPGDGVEPDDAADGTEQRIAEASQYAVLAGEWVLAAALPAPRASQVVCYTDYIIRALAVGCTQVEPPATADDRQVLWLSFFDSMIARNAVAATRALSTITETHIELYGDGWERFVEWDYPLFDPMAAAGAALARHQGLITDELSELDLRYLDPGLAEGEPAPSFPGDWPDPSVIRSSGPQHPVGPEK